MIAFTISELKVINVSLRTVSMLTLLIAHSKLYLFSYPVNQYSVLRIYNMTVSVIFKPFVSDNLVPLLLFILQAFLRGLLASTDCAS